VIRCPRLIVALLATSSLAANAQPARSLSLGAATRASESEFNRVIAVRELADESLLIADFNDRRLVHLRWDGTLRVISRMGNGPGEYRQVGHLFPLAGDSTVFVDSYSGRLLLLAADRVVGTISEHTTVGRATRGEVFGVDRSGGVLGMTKAPIVKVGAPQANATTRLGVILARRAGESVDTIAHVDIPPAPMAMSSSRPGPPRIFLGSPLTARDQAALGVDGWIAVVRLSPYRVDWRAPNGTWVRGAPLPVTPIAVTDDEKCFAMRRWSAPSAPCNVEDIPAWPAELPAFLPLSGTGAPVPVMIDPKGRAVIARTPSLRAPRNRYDIVGRDGRLVGYVELETRTMLVGFGRDAAYVSVTDSDGVQRVERRAWP